MLASGQTYSQATSTFFRTWDPKIESRLLTFYTLFNKRRNKIFSSTFFKRARVLDTLRRAPLRLARGAHEIRPTHQPRCRAHVHGAGWADPRAAASDTTPRPGFFVFSVFSSFFHANI